MAVMDSICAKDYEDPSDPSCEGLANECDRLFSSSQCAVSGCCGFIVPTALIDKSIFFLTLQAKKECKKFHVVPLVVE